MAELADALDLGSSVHDVQVQVLSSASYGAEPNRAGSYFVPFLCMLLFTFALLPFHEKVYSKYGV